MTTEATAEPTPLQWNQIIIDGKRWTFAEGPASDPEIIDVIVTQNIIDKEYTGSTRNVAALDMLMHANPTLALNDACAIILTADPKHITAIVEQAIFGAKYHEKTFSQWITSAMLANGLDPTTIPRSQWNNVVEHLLYAKRCIPPEEFITSMVSRKAQNDLLRSLTATED